VLFACTHLQPVLIHLLLQWKPAAGAAGAAAAVVLLLALVLLTEYLQQGYEECHQQGCDCRQSSRQLWQRWAL
jgi:hypothetical protein